MKIIIVSQYPPPETKHVYGSGVASYTKSLARALININPKVEVHIIGERKKGLPTLYLDDGIIVHRTFDKNPLYVFQIFEEINRIDPDIIHFQHEYFLFGNVITSMLFPLLLMLLKPINKKVIVTLHGVIPLNLLDDHNFKKENGIRGFSWALKLGLLLITKLIVILSNIVVVHEPFLKEYLVKYYKTNPIKIKVIPHGVDESETISQIEAKQKLGLKGKTVLLYFGYLTGYKGLDILLESYKHVSKKMPNSVLIIAGGLHPRLVHERWYRFWISKIISKINEIQSVTRKRTVYVTGYVPEDQIPLYFSAADIVVLPYKHRISASGPESLAISFGKPYFISGPEDSQIEPSNLARFLIEILTNNKKIKSKNKIEELKNMRKWNRIARLYLWIYKGVLKG